MGQCCVATDGKMIADGMAPKDPKMRGAKRGLDNGFKGANPLIESFATDEGDLTTKERSDTYTLDSSNVGFESNNALQEVMMSGSNETPQGMEDAPESQEEAVIEKAADPPKVEVVAESASQSEQQVSDQTQEGPAEVPEVKVAEKIVEAVSNETAEIRQIPSEDAEKLELSTQADSQEVPKEEPEVVQETVATPEPEQSEQPVQPEQSEQPVQPEQSEQPVQPEQSEQPVQPEQPEPQPTSEAQQELIQQAAEPLAADLQEPAQPEEEDKKQEEPESIPEPTTTTITTTESAPAEAAQAAQIETPAPVVKPQLPPPHPPARMAIRDEVVAFAQSWIDRWDEFADKETRSNEFGFEFVARQTQHEGLTMTIAKANVAGLNFEQHKVYREHLHEWNPLLDDKLDMFDCGEYEGTHAYLQNVTMPFMMSNRSMACLYYLNEKPDGSMEYLCSSKGSDEIIAREAKRVKKNVVGNTLCNYTKLTPRDDGTCDWVGVLCIDLAGSIPLALIRLGAEIQMKSLEKSIYLIRHGKAP